MADFDFLDGFDADGDWGFTRTFPRDQDATVKLKSELISIKS